MINDNDEYLSRGSVGDDGDTNETLESPRTHSSMDSHENESSNNLHFSEELNMRRADDCNLSSLHGLFRPCGTSPVAPAVLSLLPMGFNYKLHTVPGDGNCFFNAVAIALNDIVVPNPKYHGKQLRFSAVNHMEFNKQEYLEYFPDGESLDTYVRRMREDGSWADSPIIYALSASFWMRIDLVEFSDRYSNSPHIISFQAKDRAYSTILLQRSGQQGLEHYDAITSSLSVPSGCSSFTLR